jgi:hypothetical protein
MQFQIGKIGLCVLAFGAPDMGVGAETTPIAEIVTFKLAEGVSDTAFLTAAQTTQPFLEGRSGFLRRNLTKGADGLWTDYIEWSDLATAKHAAEHIMAQPDVLPFLEAIAPNSVEMRYEQIKWRLE